MLLDKSGYEEGYYLLESEMNSVYNDSFTTYEAFQREADIDTRFTLGDQRLYASMFPDLVNPQESQFNFNHILKVINMISGYQIKNRKSPQIIGQENSDDGTASQMTQAMLWLFQKGDFYDLISEAFRQSLITGFGAIELWLDPRSDPVSPDIKATLRSYSSMIFDPFFRQKDMSDASYVWSRSYLTRNEVNEMIPGREKDINTLDSKKNYKDEKFQYMLENWNMTNGINLMAVDSYYHLCSRKSKYFIDVYSGEQLEIEDDIDDEMVKVFLRENERIKVETKTVPSVSLALAVNGKILYKGNPMKVDRYPIIPFFGYLNTASPSFPLKIQGVPRSIRDIQFLYNRRKRAEFDIIESRGTSTLKIMQGTLVDDRQAFQTGQGRAMFIKRDAPLGMQGIEPLPPPQVGNDMIALSTQLKEEMSSIPGINEELLGTSTDDISGILSMLRQGAGLTTLRSLFDNVDYAQTLLVRECQNLMQKHWQPSKFRRITGKEPTPELKNKAFLKYDAVVINGEYSAEQRQMEFVQLLELQKLGMPIPISKLVGTMVVQNKEELIKEMEAIQKQQQEQEQRQQALEMEQIKANNELIRARALADSGLGVERISRIEENKSLSIERQAKAMKDHEAATLDSIRSVKELADMDINQFIKVYQIYKQIEQDNKLQADLAKAEEEAEAKKSQENNGMQGLLQGEAMQPNQKPMETNNV